MPKKMRKFLFDQPYYGPVAFDPRDCKIILNPNLYYQKYDLNVLTFQQCTKSTNAMQVFKDLFKIDDYELFSRMDEDKIMKTLHFINDNTKKHNLFCLVTFSKYGEQYSATIKPRPQKLSEVVFGQVIIFVVENVQEPSYNRDKSAINSLVAGYVPAEFLEKNVAILTNYQDICKKSIDEAARFFEDGSKQQNTKPIPMFLTFDCNDFVKEIKFENSHLFTSLKFAINTLLGNFYQNKIMPENLECGKTSMKLFDSVCLKTRKFSNQGPFHMWKHDLTKYMEDLVQLKHQLKNIFRDNGNQNIASIHHCFKLIRELIKKDYIPNQHSWISVDYINLDGQKESIVLLKEKCAKNWEKQLVIPSKDWIAYLKEFCGNENEHASKKENIILKDYVWLYDQNDKSSNEPYLVIENKRFILGICEEILKFSWTCEHLNKKARIQHFCVKCKRNVQINNNSFFCDCGLKLYFKKQCLYCWRSSLTTLVEKNEDQWERVEYKETGTNFIGQNSDQNKNREPNLEEQKKKLVEEMQQEVNRTSKEIADANNAKLEKELSEKRKLEFEIGNYSGEIKELRNNKKMIEKEKQKLNSAIIKLKNESKIHHSISNEVLKENQQLKQKNNENEQTINNLRMEIAQLLEVEKDLKDKLTKANKQIEKLGNPKTYTIVVVGATGVGKSTLISAMENYLKWPKLEDVAKHLNELEIRIPVQFTVTRKTGQSQVVSAGFTKNENFNNSGESVTQKPKVHLFKYGNDTVRIIDTPGLADTRGSDHDEINLKLIQKMVKNQEEIHGICIFIKSNDLKIENTVKQLLSVFPKSALNNVFFFFKHCLKTYFGIGDVMNPLKELQKKYEESHGSTFSLDWNRMHCVDSEGFRYLVCRKQKVEYSTKSEVDFHYAWDESSKEILKFFETVKTIKPIPANKIEASRKLAKWTDAMKQKESIVTPEQQEPYFHLMDCLMFMTKKHTLVLNKSELKTNIEVLSKNEFCEAIDEFLNVAEDGGRTLQKCKEIIKTLEDE